MQHKIHKEEPEFKVQKQYESQFKTKYQKMLLNMNKALILNLSNKEQADVDTNHSRVI